MSLLGNTTFKRILSAVIALPVYIFLIISDSFYSTPILGISLLISLICLYEFFLITDRGDEGRAFFKTGMSAGVIINIVIYLFAFGKVFGFGRYIGIFDARVIIAIVTIFLCSILTLQIFRRPIRGGIYSISITLFGVLYIVLSFSHIILIKALANGLFYLLFHNIIIMLNDIGAYFGGVFFGKHKTNFPVSPNKSWEGYFSGLLFSIVFSIIINEVYISFFNRTLFTTIEAAVIGIILSILGSTGDLVESAVKRDSSIKDSGSIIPGHGGMWDVFDAIIFSMPVYYYYLLLIGVP
jgi:phosphatidate cytidylyltransferase